MKVSRNRSAVLVACAAVIGLSVGGSVVAFGDESIQVLNSSGSEVQPPIAMNGEPAIGKSDNAITTAPWPENEFGLTFGEPTRADVLARNLPVLMSTFTDDGKAGFLLSEEAYPVAKNGEFARSNPSLNAKGEDIRTIYGPDGKTVLGTKVVAVFAKG